LSACRIGLLADAAELRVPHHPHMGVHARRIVVGYDGSDASWRALDAAADLVGYGATLAVVSGHPTGAADMRAAIEQAREHLLRRHVSALFAEPSGEPAEAIATAAEKLEADLIVVGGSNGAEPNAKLPSVVARVLRQAPCDVLVVR
jgi:nucleotide-binding universal stress UspA family protein